MNDSSGIAFQRGALQGSIRTNAAQEVTKSARSRSCVVLSIMRQYPSIPSPAMDREVNGSFIE